MAVSEAARHDLYTALVDSIGEQPAGTLMASLPTYEPTEVLTKADLQLHLAPINAAIAGLRTDVGRVFDELDAISRRFDAVDGRFNSVNDRFDAAQVEMNSRFDGLNQRFDAVNERLDNWWKALLAAVAIAAAAITSNVFG